MSFRVTRVWPASVALLLLAACGVSSTRLPSELCAAPGLETEADRAVAFARSRVERGDPTGALQAVATALALAPSHVDAQRVRQDLLRERGRRGLLAVEAQTRLENRSSDPAAHYLAGRLARPAAAQLPFFERALELDHRFYWGWLGLASAIRSADPGRSLAIYQRLHALAPDVVMNTVNLANSLVEHGRNDAAAEVYASLLGRQDLDGLGDLGIARVRAQQFPRHEAWAPLLAALQRRPWDSAVRQIIEAVVREGPGSDRMAQLREILFQDGGRLDAFVQAGGGPLLAEVFKTLGQLTAAREVLEASGAPPAEPRARRAWRRILLEVGEVGAFLADVRRTFPDVLLQDERNQVRGRWLTVFEGPWREAQDPLATPASATELTDALRDAGLLTEAELVATAALLRHRGADAAGRLRERRDEIRRLLAFEAGLRRVLYAGYGAAEVRDLPSTFAELRRISTEILGRDVVGEPRVFTIPFVGEIVDPFGPGLPQHFASLNQHLVLGHRLGMPVEAMLLTRLSLRDLEASREVAVPVRGREVVCENRAIEARTSLVGGDIAGIALVDNYLVDMDAVRDWAGSLLRMRRIAREDGLALLTDPLPAVEDPLEPFDAEWRLAVSAPESDEALEAGVLDVIRWHERAHLADTFHFLPPEWNLWRVLGLLWRNGFSATGVEADLEGRAELAALAMSPHTRLVMAHIAGFCRQDLSGFSPHASGFEGLARALQARLIRGGMSADEVAVSRWYALDPTKVREAAATLLAELW